MTERPTAEDIYDIFESDMVISEDYMGRDMQRVEFRWTDGKVYRFEWDSQYGVVDGSRGDPWEVVDTVKIARGHYEALKRDSKVLSHLRAYGVDNWDGWDCAIEAFQEEDQNDDD